MNLNEQLPSKFYIFVNLLNPITRHNLKSTKVFSSAVLPFINNNNLNKYRDGSINYLPFISNNNKDFGSLSIFCHNIINDYRVEYDAEICRMHYYPRYPSRLSATFAFGDYSSCIEANRKYDWDLDEVKKFKLISNQLNRVVKVNMEIVSLARETYNRGSMLPDDVNEVWNAYWSGLGNIDIEVPALNLRDRDVLRSGVIFEYLIEGMVELIDD